MRQGEHGVSLAEQRDAIERYAVQRGLSIDRWFEERRSAATAGRPEFSEMLRQLGAERAHGVVVHKIDRSARNLGDWNEVTELLDRGIDVHVAHDGMDLRSRSGRLMGDIQAVLAADYSRNLREEVRKGMRGRLKQGLLPWPAPLGYRNMGAGKVKTVDPVVGPLVRMLFERYGTGMVSLRQLFGEALRLGLRGRSGRPLRQTQLACLLHNPFFTGIIRVKRTGETYTGRHEALIPRSLFERVQRVLAGKGPRQAVRHQFVFRRLLRCAHCGRHLIGERQKGRVYYRCQTPACPTTSVREDVAESQLRRQMRGLAFASNDEWQATVATHIKQEGASGEAQHRALHGRLNAVDARLGRLTDALLDGSIDRSDFQTRKTALLMERRAIQDELSSRVNLQVRQDTVAWFLELANRADLLYESALPEEKRELIEILTSNRLVDGRTPQFHWRSPFDQFAVEAETQFGGACGVTARTGTRLRRLVKSLMSQVLDGSLKDVAERVEKVLSAANQRPTGRQAA